MTRVVLFILIMCLVFPSIKPTKHRLRMFKNPHYVPGRTTMVHLFEWKWEDIAAECKRFLGPKGFGGVQVSPPNENLVIWEKKRPWWERYQPVSYHLISRSGNEKQFISMVRECNKNGVRIYVDAVINHMTGKWHKNTGIGGSTVNYSQWDYPAVPYHSHDFHWPYCAITEYDYRCCPKRMRNCELTGLKDLNQGTEYVRDMIAKYMNRLITIGVAGFRIDAAKHMWPADLKNIYDRLHNLNTAHGFPSGARPFIYQDVIDFGVDVISNHEYTPIGVVTEFRSGYELSRAFTDIHQLKLLQTWGSGMWGLMESDDALTFIDSHDTQRDFGSSTNILNYKEPKQYKGAVAFMLAFPYGYPRLMSGFNFHDTDAGPPMTKSGDIISPSIKSNGGCGGGWICEHRWSQIYNMVAFRNVAMSKNVTDWWDNGNNQIAFCRGGSAFIAFNNDNLDLDEFLQTCLPTGVYCDVISGGIEKNRCTGKITTVRDDGKAHVIIGANEKDMMFAIHVGIELMDDIQLAPPAWMSIEVPFVKTCLVAVTKRARMKTDEYSLMYRRQNR